MSSTLFTSDGKPLQLGNKIGKGGEGEIFALHGIPGVAVKVYTVEDLRGREAKIRAMIAAGLANTSALIAFPLASVRDSRGFFAGFTMRLVRQHHAVHELYPPGARKIAFPKADYRFLIRAAANTARAVAAAHAADCVIGDINHSGILVSEQATVALIDTDSFQFTEGAKQHLCLVGVPEYTPPELQGKGLNLLRTPNHDAFGLALVCFQLLWMGRHPFAGRYAHGDMPFERAIAEFRFAYSRARTVGMEPPPAVPALDTFPTPIANAFEQAFGPSGVQSRPTAKQWISLLAELERELRTCSAVPQHQYPPTAKQCPWCQMERAQGIVLFQSSHGILRFPTAPSGGTIGNWQTIWRAIESIQAPSAVPSVPSFSSLNLSPSQDALSAKSNKDDRRIAGVVTAILSVILFAGAPAGAIFWLIGFATSLYLLLGTDKSNVDFTRKARDFEQRWANSVAQWQAGIGDTAFMQAKSSLSAIKQQIEGLPSEEHSSIQQYELKRGHDQLKHFLDRYQIRHVNISGIGRARLALLASYGIETAGDITPAALLRVPGVGPAISRPLLEWRRSVESSFKFSSPFTPADTKAVANIKSEITNKAQGMTARLAQGPVELSRAVANIEQLRRTGTPELQNLYREREQLAADLRFLGIAAPHPAVSQTIYQPPTVRPSPNPIGPGPSSPSPRPFGSLACPQCGNPMVGRIARRGGRRGRRFYGCSRYPACHGTRPFP
jgi:DNA-binding helix-hairpin-helix protein with protein kinase domain